jgi:hypothetical protein
MNFQEYIKFEFDRLNSKIDRVESMIRGFPVKSNENLGDWLTEIQAQELLSYKTTSLWALRKTKKIKSSKIGGKTYYSKQSIIDFLDKSKTK